MTLRTTHAVGAVVLLVASGVGHGMWTHRWSSANGPAVAADYLAGLDRPVGDWQGGTPQAVAEKDTPKGTHATARTFVSEKSGKKVIVSLTSGVPGVVAAHTPDVCFLGSGYALKAPPTKQTLPLGDGSAASFYVADFEKTSATGTETVRCRWSWSADGTWHAPDYPRLFFAKSQVSLPVLYKLYVVHPLGEDDLNKSDPYRTFAADLAAALGRQFPR
ncbi:MAG TPA: hypothetical protein VM597_24100 [Gemmataceae bacterium]|jgi:hypothetical protein|nr:hypothetical protein [Gemmataceae bacterium]